MAGDKPLIEDERFREKLAAVEVELKALEITQLRVVAAERNRAAAHARDVGRRPSAVVVPGAATEERHPEEQAKRAVVTHPGESLPELAGASNAEPSCEAGRTPECPARRTPCLEAVRASGRLPDAAAKMRHLLGGTPRALAVIESRAVSLRGQPRF